MTNVTQQKGVSSSTPNGFKRWLMSHVMTYMGSAKRQARLRNKHEVKRQNQGRRHTVEYFHQVDDGYSHLAIQLLADLKAQYDIDLVVHIVPPLRDDNFPEPDLLKVMAQADAKNIAPFYNVTFSAIAPQTLDTLSNLATGILCQLDAEQILTIGVEVSNRLWRGDIDGLTAMANQHGSASEQTVNTRLMQGAERRKTLQHYSGAMFWYEGEWYWGIDRLYHLEQRLASLNLCADGQSLVAPRPVIPSEFDKRAQQLTLEFYPSLRSPYTAVAWEPTMKLAKDSAVNFVVRPVLPMVMRGVPATMQKAKYIVTDAAREARAQGVDYGTVYDPIGEPVMRGYSLYMWALTKGKGTELLGAFLNAAFAKGINTNARKGLQQVVDMAQLDWQEAKDHLHDNSWQERLEENRLTMYGFGSWGVPSYRLLDADGNELVNAWGQDRVWLIAEKIIENS